MFTAKVFLFRRSLSGKKDQLVGRIQERYGIARDEADKQADEWAKALKDEKKVSPARSM
jgi:hypothetical protein